MMQSVFRALTMGAQSLVQTLYGLLKRPLLPTPFCSSEPPLAAVLAAQAASSAASNVSDLTMSVAVLGRPVAPAGGLLA